MDERLSGDSRRPSPDESPIIRCTLLTVMFGSRLNSILNWSVKVCRLFGIPIYLHISILFFLWVAFPAREFGLARAAEFALGLILSILMHELGHALMAKQFRMTDLTIMLHGFGGFATSRGYRTPKLALMITLAGPVVTFIVGGVCLAIGNYGMNSAAEGSEVFLQSFLVWWLGSINILLGFLNLVPCLPFDGGNALRAILSFKRAGPGATRLAAAFGLLFGPAVLIYGLSAHDNFIAAFGFIGLLTSLSTLSQLGGLHFNEFFARRRSRRERDEYRARQDQKHRSYIEEVQARSREREERARLRKLFEDSVNDDRAN